MTPETEKHELWKLVHRNLIQVGNSVAITIHKDEREKLGLEKGDSITVKVFDDGEMLLEPTRDNG